METLLLAQFASALKKDHPGSDLHEYFHALKVQIDKQHSITTSMERIIFALSLAHNRRGPAAGRCIMNLYSIVPQFLILPAKCIVRGTKVLVSLLLAKVHLNSVPVRGNSSKYEFLQSYCQTAFPRSQIMLKATLCYVAALFKTSFSNYCLYSVKVD